MKPVRATLPILLAVMLPVGGFVSLMGQDNAGAKLAKTASTTGGKKTATTGTPATDSEAAAAAEAKGLGAFGKLLPLNEKNIDVKIPSFQEGQPSSLVRAGSMTRVDDENMELEKTDIRLYGEVQDKDVRVQIVTGKYNMPTQVLSSDERCRVSRADFQIEGDSMIFDTRTQQGKLMGNVQMTIFDTAAMMGTQPVDATLMGPPKPGEEPKPATAKPEEAGKTGSAPPENAAKAQPVTDSTKAAAAAEKKPARKVDPNKKN